MSDVVPERGALEEHPLPQLLLALYRSRTSATLRGGYNVVVMYSDPAGEVYVNGRSLANSEGIESGDGTLMVPVSLVGRIRAAMRTGPENPPPPPRDDTTPRITQRPPGKTIGKVSYAAGRRDPIVFELGPHLGAGKNELVVLHESQGVLPYSLAVEFRSVRPASRSSSGMCDMDCRNRMIPKTLTAPGKVSAQ